MSKNKEFHLLALIGRHYVAIRDSEEIVAFHQDLIKANREKIEELYALVSNSGGEEDGQEANSRLMEV